MCKTISSLVLASLGLMAVSAQAADCTDLPDYVDSQAYLVGAEVRNLGSAYQCEVAGWCSTGGPYAPGDGWAWPNAWTELGACNGEDSPPDDSDGGGDGGSGAGDGGDTGGGSDGDGTGDDSGGDGSTGADDPAALECEGRPVWSAGEVYTGGDQVQHQAVRYQAKWWTQGDDPEQYSDAWEVWENQGACPDADTGSGGDSGSGDDTGGDSGDDTGGGSDGGTGDDSGGDTGGGSDDGTGDDSGGDTGGGSGTPGDFMPRHALIGFWHNFVNGSGCPFPLSEVDPAWDVIDIAFADNGPNNDGTVEFNLYDGDPQSDCPALDPQQFKADMAELQSQGKVVALSLGGAEGTITLNDAEDQVNFVNSMTGIIEEWGFDGLDVDLESGSNLLHGTQIQARLPEALQQIDTNVGGMFLSMAPEHPFVHGGMVAMTGIWGAYIPVIDGTRDILDVLHVQLYNNGGLPNPYMSGSAPAGSIDMMVASSRMLIRGFDLANGDFFEPLRPDQVALGLPSGPSSAGSGLATNSAIMSALDCITSGIGCDSIDAGGSFPDFRGVMTWSINWDRHDGFIFSGPTGNKLDNLP